MLNLSKSNKLWFPHKMLAVLQCVTAALAGTADRQTFFTAAQPAFPITKITDCHNTLSTFRKIYNIVVAIVGLFSGVLF